jgi:hypothetical protein
LFIAGGAVYSAAPSTDSSYRYFARCQFVKNVAGTANGGNDIKDLKGSSSLWNLGIFVVFW